MLNKIESIFKKAQEFTIDNINTLEEFKRTYLRFKIKELFIVLKDSDAKMKKILGPKVNKLKQYLDDKYKESLVRITNKNINDIPKNLDYTLRYNSCSIGAHHPLSLVRDRMISILGKLGFNLADGPEIEDDWHNFTALNVPQDHPARDLQDTFFISDDMNMMLRTHTSSVQIRSLEKGKLPLRIISTGRTYRNETISARSHCMFHQFEGLYVDENVTFMDLKEVIDFLFKELFGCSVKTRYRPSYFPFTEPSVEIDVTCTLCNGKGCSACKHSGWLEVCGGGMVDPNVLINTGVDPKIYSGFAFGSGLERLTMLLYHVEDIRYFTNNDLRFLRYDTNAL